MAAETTTYTPQKLFAGDHPRVVTQPCTVLSGQDLAAFTIVESDADGKLITHAGFVDDGTATTIDITAPVVGVLTAAVDASAADVDGTVYTSGYFFASQLIWHADASNELLKRKLLEGSDIQVEFQDTGEV